MRLIGLMSLIGLMGLVGCSGDEISAEPQEHEASIELSASMSAVPYHMAETRGATRSWTVPDGYLPYDRLYAEYGTFVNFQDLSRSTIDLCLTHDGSLTTPNPLQTRLRYHPAPEPSTSRWKLMLPNTVGEDAVKQGTYYAYGLIPREAADNLSIARLDPENPTSTYADGAVLTIQGLQTVANDACVIIGAKEGPDADHDNGLRAGDFSFQLNTGESATNYLYLLFDHLCSALCIGMRVDGDYNLLRTIKLKELRLQTANSEGTTKKKMDVTVTLHANGTGANPISSVVFTPTGTEVCDGVVYSSDEGLTLTTAYSMLLGHFIPHGVTKLILTSTYDVYDKNVTTEHPEGNLIRKDCKATNTIPLSVIDRFSEASRGTRYTINMTIKPTYLYMLSDPDLNNPSVEFEN